MAKHQCVACAHLDPEGKKRPRPVVNHRRPYWCATHWRLRFHLRPILSLTPPTPDLETKP